MARVAFIVDRSFDERQFQAAFDRFLRAGHDVILVGTRAGAHIYASGGGTFHVTIDLAVDDVDVDELDAAIVPGGTPLNHLRTHERILDLLRDLYAHGKPVGVMRDEGWALVRAGVNARDLMTWPSLKRALIVDPLREVGEEVALREQLVVSDTVNAGAFCDAFLAQVERGPRGAQKTHEHVDAFPEEVVNDVTGPAPTDSF